LSTVRLRRAGRRARKTVHTHSFTPYSPLPPLPSAEGFPRADVDLFVVRAARNRVICLRNDLAVKEREVEEALYAVHALGPSLGQQAAAAEASSSAAAALSGSGSGSAAARSAASPAVGHRPFAVVDAITPGSPAAAAGLAVGDRIVSFGDLRATGLEGAEVSGSAAAAALAAAAGPSVVFPRLQDIGALVQRSEGVAVAVTVLRMGGGGEEGEGGSLIQLTLTPCRWSGPGLLGCHIMPCDSPR
jgi:26S proteasome non-ATPase regulatory subunit 9